MTTDVNNFKTESLSESSSRVLAAISGSLWPAVLDAIPGGVSVHSERGAIVWANKELCGIYGDLLSKLKGLTCDDVFHTDDPACPHAEVLAVGSQVRSAREVRVSGRTLSVTVSPLVDEDNKICGFVRVMQDLARTNSADEHLLTAERLATLGQLLSMVAHDAGTPLNVISGYAEYLLMRAEPSGQGSKELRAILDQTRRIAAMFNQVLDLAGLPQGRIEPIEIKTLLGDSLDLVGRHLRKASVKTQLTCGSVPSLIYGEATQLRQAFFNLFLNAGRLVGDGGHLQLAITESDEMPGFLGLALFGTEATGVGRDFSRSFADFISGESGPEASRIGLYLARVILDEAGARVSTVPAEDEGIGLMIYLPATAGARA